MLVHDLAAQHSILCPMTLTSADELVAGAVRVSTQVSPNVPVGHALVMVDTSHPEVDLFTSVDDADALVVACHLTDERAVRDRVKRLRRHGP